MAADFAMFHNPIPLVFALYFFAAGITLYEALHNALIGLYGYRRSLFASFALTCLCSAIFQVASGCLYIADSLTFADVVFRVQLAAAALFFIPFTVFVTLYAGQTASKRQIAGMVICFGAIALLIAFSSYGMRFSALEFAAPLVMPWGEKLNRFSGNIDGAGWLLRILFWLVFMWALAYVLARYRTGQRHSALFLAVCILLLMSSYIWGTLIDLGLVKSIYLAGFAYLGFVLLMSFSLSLDIHAQTVRLTNTVANLQKTETSLRESESRLRNLGDRLPDSYLYEYTKKDDGVPKFLYLSSGVERLHGVKVKEVLFDAGKLFAQIAPEQLRDYYAAEAASMRDKTGFAMDMRICRADGQWRWLQFSSSPRRKIDGRVVWDGVATDITERIALLQALEKNIAMLRRINYTQQRFIETGNPLESFGFLLKQLLEATGSESGFIGTLLTSTNGHPYLSLYALSDTACNGAARAGIDKNSAQEMECHHLDGLVGAVMAHGESVIANDIADDSRLSGISVLFTQIKAFLGIPIYYGADMVGIAGLANRRGGYDETVVKSLTQYVTTCAIMIDAYRNKRIRQEAEAALVLHASVFENAWEGIIITDARCRILTVNEAFLHMSGYSKEEVLGKNLKMLGSGRQNAGFYKAMWDAINSTGHWRGEIWNRKKNGELYAEILTLSAVKSVQGEITNYVGIFADITELKKTQQRLEHLANYDPVTGLPNRILLADRLQQSLAQAARNEALLAVCFIDLDGFKLINDKYGHETGDKLLMAVAKRLSDAVRGGDTVSRLGGDEFVILLVNVADMDEIGSAMSRILDSVAASFTIDNHKLHISASLGLTIFPLDNSDCDALVRHADSAMYEAKQAGRNRFHLFDAGLDQQTQIRHKLLQRLRNALRQHEFRLYYQPKVNLRTGRVIGMEALLRWQHPERGLLTPSEFLPLTESSDLIVEIGDWVLDNVLAQIRDWRQRDLEMQVSVNVAARQLQHPNFLAGLGAVLAKYPDVPASLLELEILETAALETGQCSKVVMNAYKLLGISFALDDFGTGYSTLAYLKQLPVKMLKIDQAFVRDMLEDREDQAIIKGIVQLAEVFRVKVLAEGVESSHHAAKLLEMGCDLAQGWGIAPPMPVDEVISWVLAYHSKSDEQISN